MKFRTKYGEKPQRRAVLAGILLIMVIFCLTGCGSSRKNLSIGQYVITDVSGLSTRANATVYLDIQGIYTALAGVDASAEERAAYDSFIASLNITVNKNEKLANGDQVVVTVTYDEEEAKNAGISVSDFVKSVTVSGLNEGYAIDVFQDFELIVSGVAPYAFVTYVNNSEDEYISGLEYEIQGKTSGISNGDTITVQCNINAQTAELYYYYTDITSMNYTVEGLDSYIYDTGLLDLQVLNDIAAECAQTIRDETDDTTTRMMYQMSGSSNYLYQDNNEWVDYLKLNQVIFLSNTSTDRTVPENRLYFVYEAGVANNFYYENGYFIFEYTNAILSGNNEFMMGRNEPEARYVCGTDFDALYSDLMKEDVYKYDSTLVEGIVLPE